MRGCARRPNWTSSAEPDAHVVGEVSLGRSCGSAHQRRKVLQRMDAGESMADLALTFGVDRATHPAASANGRPEPWLNCWHGCRPALASRSQDATKDGSRGQPGKPGKRVRERSSCPRILGRSDTAPGPALDTFWPPPPTLGIAQRRLMSRWRPRAPLTERSKACLRFSCSSPPAGFVSCLPRQDSTARQASLRANAINQRCRCRRTPP
jgi:hypothetical protein